MKKQAAFLFLPLFFAFNGAGGHEFHAPRFAWHDERPQVHESHRGLWQRFWERPMRSEAEESDQESELDAFSETDSDRETSVPEDETATDTESISSSASTSSMPGVPNTGTPVQASQGDPNSWTMPVVFPSTTPHTTASSGMPVTVPPESESIFSTGAVTFRFDDGWSSQRDVALPVLEAAGIKGTFYIVTHQLSDEGFSGFLSKSDVLALAARGHDVGAHTQTHPHLPTLSSSAQRAEIEGSRSDLIAMGITPTSLSYPYGEYSPETVSIAKAAGFSGAVTTIETPATVGSDRFQIESPTIRASDSVARIEAMIDSAIANKQWLMLAFHRIDSSGDEYSITPENFKRIVDYVQSKGIRSVTVTEGLSSL